MGVRALSDIAIDDHLTCQSVAKCVLMTGTYMYYEQVDFDDPIHFASYSLSVTILFGGP